MGVPVTILGGYLSDRFRRLGRGSRMAYGLGWGLFETPHGRAAFKEGHGDGFEHYSVIFPEKGMGVVIMTNSANGESLYKELLEITIADTYTPLEWNGYVPYDQAENPADSR